MTEPPTVTAGYTMNAAMNEDKQRGGCGGSAHSSRHVRASGATLARFFAGRDRSPSATVHHRPPMRMALTGKTVGWCRHVQPRDLRAVSSNGRP